MPFGFGMYSSLPLAIRLLSDIAQARVRAASTIATSVADTFNIYAGMRAQQWNMFGQIASMAAPGYWPPPGYQGRADPYTAGQPATTAFTEGDENYHASVELPSASPDEISVSVRRDAVEVKTRARGEGGSDRVAWVPIPSDVDREKIAAEFRDGVLHVRLPKESKGTRREVKVKVVAEGAPAGKS